MRMALLLAGQARSIDKLPYHPRSVVRFIDQYKPDVYCSFWLEPEALKAIELFQPKQHDLSTEEEFQQDKHEWWYRWSKIVNPKDCTEQRRKWYWNELPDRRSRDNTIRHWSRMTAGNHLIKETYDIVVVTRTDIDFRHGTTIKTDVALNTIYGHNRSEGSHLDRLFWGDHASINRLLLWSKMIEAMAHAETSGKHGRRPMAHVRDSRWLGPENTLMVTMKHVGLEYSKQIHRTDIIR